MPVSEIIGGSDENIEKLNVVEEVEVVDDLSEDDMSNDVDSADGEVVELILVGWISCAVGNNSFTFPASVT